MNGTLKRTIALRLAENKKGPTRWDEEVPLALANMRQLQCASTGKTPHELMMGWGRNSSLSPTPKPNPEKHPPTTKLPSWVKVGAPVYVKQPVGRMKSAVIEQILSPWVVRLLYAPSGVSGVQRRATCSMRYLTRKPDTTTTDDGDEENQFETEEEMDMDETLPWVEPDKLAPRARHPPKRLIQEI
jgi:hypothetical protein